MKIQTLPPLKMLVAGEWISGSSGEFEDVYNPAEGTLLGRLPLAGREDLVRAAESSRKAFESWRSVPPSERTAILMEAARRIAAEAGELARLTTLELGLPLTDAQSLVMRGAEVLSWDANEGRRLYGRIVPTQPGLQHSVLREPYGPVAAFTPWNGSVFTPCRKIGSALAAGCSIVLKPAEETPFSTIALVRIFERAGVPPGVINLVYGNPGQVSDFLIRSPEIRMVSFTGSVPVGRQLAKLAAQELKPIVLELGGHAPVVVCEDADIVDAATLIAQSKFFNAGQVCLAPSRVYVHDSVHDEFVERIIAAAQAIRVGNGIKEGVAMGPLSTEHRMVAVDEMVQDAISRGAVLRCGGRRIGNTGSFYPPTVLTGAPADARIMQEEPFGPVLTVNRFDDVEEAIVRANSLPFGLAAFGFTRSASRGHRLWQQLEAGVVGINSLGVSSHGIPFGGIKNSGSGREGGIEGIASYTYAKTVVQRFA